MKKKTPKPVRMVSFKDNKGRVVRFPETASIGDLTKLGMRDFSLQPEGTPVPDGYFASVELNVVGGNVPVVVAKCVGCGGTRDIKAGEVPPGEQPMCEKCGMPMVAVKAKQKL